MSDGRLQSGDPLFRGCTRHATFLGVPLIPFLGVNGCCVILAMYFSLHFLFLSPVLTFVCRQLCANDDAFFKLLQLRLMARLEVRNVRANDGLWIVSPLMTRRMRHAP